MATAKAITQALARLRADRPGLGLEDSIDSHWLDWFGGPEFRDEDLGAAVLFWLEDTPARTWPTVAEIEKAIRKVEVLRKEQRELEAGPCFWDCTNGLVHKTLEHPYRHTALVPCECPKGRAKLAALRSEPAGNRFRINAAGEGFRLEEPGS